MTLEEFTRQFPVIHPVIVAWGEMDAFQHVNNVVYLRYFESARIAYMQAIGLNTNLSQNNNPIGPILADSYCRYRRPVTFPDTLHIGCRISEMQEFGFVMEYEAYSEKQETVVTIGNSRIVMVNYHTGEKSAVPHEIVQSIENFK